MLQSPHHLSSPLLDSLQELHVSLVLGSPEVDTVLQERISHSSTGSKHLSSSPCPPPADLLPGAGALHREALKSCLWVHYPLSYKASLPMFLLDCINEMNDFLLSEREEIPGGTPLQVEEQHHNQCSKNSFFLFTTHCEMLKKIPNKTKLRKPKGPNTSRDWKQNGYSGIHPPQVGVTQGVPPQLMSAMIKSTSPSELPVSST
ncbi:uncharacterized protein [Struthio camelus]|uniref:uncharacterized protein n=1 Tax=Struthio camelus TaxID=8801 RepID=UPI003603B10C